MSRGLAALVIVIAWTSGCRAHLRVGPPPVPPVPGPAVPAAGPSAVASVARTGYTVQVGAFSVLANAVKLTQALNSAGLDAFAYPAESGLYRVRFGDFASGDSAANEAVRAVKAGLIKEYFIVSPRDHPVTRLGFRANELGDRLAATAASFIGAEYAWGGTTSGGGFDCSGLVRAVYHLNGLSLPRSVADQYQAGTAVTRDGLSKGDLVFFSGPTGAPLSHVGIYLGNRTFIHAPGTGKRVREDSLDSAYFKDRFSGARTYVK
jgi:cell wall-associated NlpC family hydrolase